MRNISTNISALGRRTHLKLGELSSLFIVYNITIFFYFVRCIVFDFIFYCVTAHTLYFKSQSVELVTTVIVINVVIGGFSGDDLK